MKAILNALVKEDRKLLSKARKIFVSNFDLERDFDNDPDPGYFDGFMQGNSIEEFMDQNMRRGNLVSHINHESSSDDEDYKIN